MASDHTTFSCNLPILFPARHCILRAEAHLGFLFHSESIERQTKWQALHLVQNRRPRLKRSRFPCPHFSLLTGLLRRSRSSSSHSSTQSLGLGTGLDSNIATPQTTGSGSPIDILSSKGALPGIIVGALVLLSVLATIARRLRQRNAAAVFIPPPPPVPLNMSTPPTAINIYSTNVAPPPPPPPPSPPQVHPMAYNYGSAPPTPYSPVTFPPPAPNMQHHASFNQHLNPNASYRPAVPSNPAPQSPHLSTNSSEPNYYGEGKYALSWDPATPAPRASASPPGPNSLFVGSVDHSNALPPSYEQQWRG
ncbi:hypothetical protein B0H13DRAFT_2034837 [Mycena leptocephala]|nr:hypothetical protein B0H13DRAFT_2034837 [Mycena leptocephala]